MRGGCGKSDTRKLVVDDCGVFSTSYAAICGIKLLIPFLGTSKQRLLSCAICNDARSVGSGFEVTVIDRDLRRTAGLDGAV